MLITSICILEMFIHLYNICLQQISYILIKTTSAWGKTHNDITDWLIFGA
jgi:hypothetical protein